MLLYFYLTQSKLVCVARLQLLHPVHNPGQFLVSLNLTKCNIPESGQYP